MSTPGFKMRLGSFERGHGRDACGCRHPRVHRVTGELTLLSNGCCLAAQRRRKTSAESATAACAEVASAEAELRTTINTLSARRRSFCATLSTRVARCRREGKSGTRSRQRRFLSTTKRSLPTPKPAFIDGQRRHHVNDNVGPTAFGASSSCFVCKCKAVLPGCRFTMVIVGAGRRCGAERHLSTFGSRLK
jgi:hypothetical protein